MCSCISVGIHVCISTEMHARILLASRLGLRARSCAHALVSTPLLLSVRCFPRHSVSSHPSYGGSSSRLSYPAARSLCDPCRHPPRLPRAKAPYFARKLLPPRPIRRALPSRSACSSLARTSYRRSVEPSLPPCRTRATHLNLASLTLFPYALVLSCLRVTTRHAGTAAGTRCTLEMPEFLSKVLMPCTHWPQLPSPYS